MASCKTPAAVQFMLEGQEEIGSPQLDAFLAQHTKLLAADAALSADGGQVSLASTLVQDDVQGHAASACHQPTHTGFSYLTESQTPVQRMKLKCAVSWQWACQHILGLLSCQHWRLRWCWAVSERQLAE